MLQLGLMESVDSSRFEKNSKSLSKLLGCFLLYLIYFKITMEARVRIRMQNFCVNSLDIHVKLGLILGFNYCKKF